ncbi:DUF2207 domain-containing protein [Nocardioides soli]|uniref:DUF2207 domain-containing protein n=1 Tax=Nocardioides soli TaxID=1036020 RepID=A0A7W4Z0A4_9ACTN|nr:DUF2207 domain-containing protein [Nocardioides soli]MBB3042109.1 hypothetical protein [Nocardioides soli]
MKRVVGGLVGLVVVVLVLLAPALFYGLDLGSGDVDEPTTITSYVADFDVAENGDLSVAERLTVDVPVYGRHGIFRYFDTHDASAPHARREPEDIEVTMDGEDVPVELLSERRGRYVNARIGDPDATLPVGEHVFEIRYRIAGVLEEGTTGQPTQFYWNLIPGGWQQPIERSRLTVRLPAPAQDVRCAVGAGAGTGCTAKGEGTRELVVRTRQLAPNTPVTLKAGLDLPTPPAGTTLPWRGGLDPILGTSVPVLAVVLLLAGGAGALGYVLVRGTRETDPQLPLMYAPPEGIGPAQAAYLVTEDVDQEQYVATLMYAAERGAIELDRSGDDWTITDKGGSAGWAGLDPVTTGVAHLLSGPGTSFVASSRDVQAGKRLKSEIASFEKSTRSWASGAGLMVGSGLGGIGGLIIGACGIAVLAVAIWNPFDMTAIGLVPGLFAVFGAGLAATGAGTKRTRAGRDLWSRAGGFRRILSTPSAQDRFDFSGREELYTAYIPWAVAFGCADEWAAKYRTEMGSEPPVPSYLGHAYAGASVGSAVSSMVDDFETTVSSAISAYEATQKSSSSGGGGFSGGGGGGGGGGGSW